VILEIKNLKKFFGGISAVHDVTFRLEAREISSIIGPNGAGKTTLFNLITGKLSPDAGEVYFNGENISRLPPFQICHKKLGRSFQITNIFPKLSAFENIQVAILSSRGINKNFFNRADRMVKKETMEVLSNLGLAKKKDVLGGLLAHGDQKLLDIGISLASTPDLILLDEPTAGMSPEETLKTTELVTKLAKERGMTVLLIEHDMNVVFSISEIIRVMHQGKLIAEGKPDEIKSNSRVQQIYLGKQE
jgi:branched-chain amino acid transport system ATP-binding protein